jgi:hypothetical protein
MRFFLPVGAAMIVIVYLWRRSAVVICWEMDWDAFSRLF